MRPGASVGYVRATRTSLPRWVRTGGTGRPAPGHHALYVLGTRARLGRTVPYVPRAVATQVIGSANSATWHRKKSAEGTPEAAEAEQAEPHLLLG